MPNDRETIALPGLPGWRFERTAVTSSFYNLVNRDGASAVTWEEARAFAAALTAQPAPVAGQPARKTCELAEGGVGLDEIERLNRLREEWGRHIPLGEDDHAWLLGRAAVALARPVSPQDAGVVRDRVLEVNGDLYQHRKGGTYRKLFEARIQTDEPLQDMAWVVVYQGEKDGTLWARRCSEFDDGRFTFIEGTTQPSDQPEKAEASASDHGRVRDAVLEEAINAVGFSTRVNGPLDSYGDNADEGYFNAKTDAQNAIRALKQSTQPAQAGAGVVGQVPDGWQARNVAWMDRVFDGDPTDLAERVHRFTEEALELAQAFGQTADEASQLVGYVHSQDHVGEPAQEFGGAYGTMTLLAAFTNHDLQACGETELARVSTPEMVAKIREKRSRRHGRGPLPGTYAPDFIPATAPQPPTDPSSREGVKAEGDGIRNAGHSYLTPEALHPIVETAADRRRKAEGQDGNAGAGR